MLMTLTRRLIVPIALAASLLIPATAAAQFRYEQNVVERLAALGIEPDQIIDLNIYPQRDPNDQFGGAQAWVRVEQCPEGWIVMRLGRLGNVTYTYTRDGCMLAGLD